MLTAVLLQTLRTHLLTQARPASPTIDPHLNYSQPSKFSSNVPASRSLPGLKESDTTEQLNWTELNVTPGIFIKGKWMDLCYMGRGEEDVKLEHREIWRCFAIALKMEGATGAKLECSSRSWKRQGRTAVYSLDRGLAEVLVSPQGNPFQMCDCQKC